MLSDSSLCSSLNECQSPPDQTAALLAKMKTKLSREVHASPNPGQRYLHPLTTGKGLWGNSVTGIDPNR